MLHRARWFEIRRSKRRGVKAIYSHVSAGNRKDANCKAHSSFQINLRHDTVAKIMVTTRIQEINVATQIHIKVYRVRGSFQKQFVSLTQFGKSIHVRSNNLVM